MLLAPILANRFNPRTRERGFQYFCQLRVKMLHGVAVKTSLRKAPFCSCDAAGITRSSRIISNHSCN